MAIAIGVLFGFGLAAVIGTLWARGLARHARGTEILGTARLRQTDTDFWAPPVDAARPSSGAPPAGGRPA